MAKKCSKQKYKRSSRANYFEGGGDMSTPLGADIAIGIGNAIASNFNAYAEKKHQQYMQNQQNQAFDNELMAEGRDLAEQNALALQQNKDARLQQFQSMVDTMQIPQQQPQQDPNIMQPLGMPPNKFFIGGMIQMANAVDQGLGKVVGGEYESGVGSALSALPGGGLIGGAINRLFGMKTNQAELNRVKQDTAALANQAAQAQAATSFDSSALSGGPVINTNVNAYTGGVFSKGKAARKNAELQTKLLAQKDMAGRTAEQSISNIQDTQNAQLAATFAAYGGLLGGYASNKFGDGGIKGPIFNPATKEWIGYNGKPLKRKHEKSFGYTLYTDDGFAVNYNHKGREIGRKKGTQTPYIGGKTRNIQEQKYFDRNQELTDSVKVIAKRYGINPNLVASRIGREIVDDAIDLYNISGGKQFITNDNSWAVGPMWGLDDTYSRIQNGDVVIKEPWVQLKKQEFTNEHGRETESVYSKKWSDMVSATAAELAARRAVMKKRFPKMTNKQLDAAASASFNMGETGATNAIRKGGYSAVSDYSPFIQLKAFGGSLDTQGASFPLGITYINNGGTHEENSFEGVPMGVDQQGVPNLVEEGEVIYEDYVFSNRLKVPKTIREKYKLKGTKTMTFADAAKQMSKEAEERPNDTISNRGLQDNMEKLMIAQEEIRMAKQASQGKQFAKGGKMGRLYSDGGTKDQFLDLMAFGHNLNGYSTQEDRLSLDQKDSSDTSNGGKYSQWLKNIPSITPKSLSLNLSNVDYSRLSPLYNAKLSSIGKNPYDFTYNKITPEKMTQDGSPIPYSLHSSNFFKAPQFNFDEPVSSNELSQDTQEMAPTWMRYAPAIGSGVMALTDALGLTNKPDYTDANTLANAAQQAAMSNPVSFNPIGNYLTYRPFDIEFAANQANAESAAARRALLNTSGGNRAQAMAGILAADQNALNQLGILRRGAAEDNRKQEQAVEEFNRATNQFNSEGFFNADVANQRDRRQALTTYLSGINAATELRQKERLASEAAKSANLSNFINSLGDIGRENFARNMVTSDPSKYYTIDNNGQVSYKKSYLDLDDDAKSKVDAEIKEKQGKIKKALEPKKGGR